MKTLVFDDSGHALIAAMEEKALKLVWYARTPSFDDPSWDKVPADIKQTALNQVSLVEEMFPVEIDGLNCSKCGDWSHGFNSGMLAALRFVLHVAEDPEAAIEEFPELDT
jgi:hypothetical protein